MSYSAYEAEMLSKQNDESYRYELRHGWGPGTLPKNIEVLEHTVDGYKDYVTLNRKLTPEELKKYDIKERNDTSMSNDFKAVSNGEFTLEYENHVYYVYDDFIEGDDSLLFYTSRLDAIKETYPSLYNAFVKKYGVIEDYDNNDDEDEDAEDGYDLIDHKKVMDSDGFYTDYTMYLNTTTGEYVFVFGDRDIYRPEDGSFDHVADSEDEAWEWFNNYEGFADEDEDIYSSTELDDVVQSKLEDITFVMENYVNGTWGMDVDPIGNGKFFVDYDDKFADVQFNLNVDGYVYTVNGAGPFEHSSYEYIANDIYDVLMQEQEDV